MIRLAALACGLICATGFVLSGVYDPAVLREFVLPQATRSFTLGIALLVAALVACLVIALARNRDAPVLGGTMEPVPGTAGWKPLAAALLFGLGWGLSGYFPLAALVSAGAFSPGAATFLISVLAGMFASDVITGKYKSGDTERRSRG